MWIKFIIIISADLYFEDSVPEAKEAAALEISAKPALYGDDAGHDLLMQSVV